ncbi:hypothetical protein [Pseudomonas putida]
MLLPPDLAEYRFALYCQTEFLGLPTEPQQPVCLYRDKISAVIHGQRMWPSTYHVIDLHGEDSPCGNRN